VTANEVRSDYSVMRRDNYLCVFVSGWLKYRYGQATTMSSFEVE